jgi:prepilin-type processing-associated H-X9-DG protein
LWTVFYVFALVAAALATFGAWGIVAAAYVLGFWTWAFYSHNRAFTLAHLLLVFLLVGMLLACLFLPAMSSAREAARRNQCQNNLKQLALALANYEVANGTLPPAFVADANGKPMHSWRVLVLPFLGEQALFAKYNLNEPWDGPNNSKLAGQMPAVFRCPAERGGKGSAATETHYFAVVGDEAAFPGDKVRKIAQFRDGTAHTMVLLEATGLGVNWMEPRDMSLVEAVELLTTKARSGHTLAREGFLTTTYYETSQRNAAFCDGHIDYVGQFANPAVARGMLTVAGGEPIVENFEERYVETVATTVVKWKAVYALCVFLILSLLPAAWVPNSRRRRAAVSSEAALGNAQD